MNKNIRSSVFCLILLIFSIIGCDKKNTPTQIDFPVDIPVDDTLKPYSDIELLFPMDYSRAMPLNPDFIWKKYINATSYHLQVSTTISSATLVFDKAEIKDTICKLNDLKNSTIYFWRVKPKLTDENANWSRWKAFITEPKSCPGIENVEYHSKKYNTVQIGSQCWLRENLDVGEMKNSWITQSDNGVTEKYCYNDDPENCKKYGGLYQFAEAVQFRDESDKKVQGICPDGWHIPTNDEIKILMQNVNNDFNALKEFCVGNGPAMGNNSSGFSALLSGTTNFWGGFQGLNDTTDIIINTHNGVYYSVLELYGNLYAGGYITGARKTASGSVRCIKDN